MLPLENRRAAVLLELLQIILFTQQKIKEYNMHYRIVGNKNIFKLVCTQMCFCRKLTEKTAFQITSVIALKYDSRKKIQMSKMIKKIFKFGLFLLVTQT